MPFLLACHASRNLTTFPMYLAQPLHHVCKVYLPSDFECFIQVAAVDGSALLWFEVDDLKEAQCLETLFEFEFVRLDCDFIQAIKNKKPNTVRCDADEINVYSQEDSLLAHSFHRQLHKIDLIISYQDWHLQPQGEIIFHFFFTTPDPTPFTPASLQYCGLPVCSSRIFRMEIGLGKMKKHQSIVARPSPSLGVSFWAVFDNTWLRIVVIVYNSLMYSCFFAASEFVPATAFRSDCYGFTIPSTWVCVSAFSATCCGLTVMELHGHHDKFWLSWGFVCCFVGWDCRNPLRASIWACM